MQIIQLYLLCLKLFVHSFLKIISLHNSINVSSVNVYASDSDNIKYNLISLFE